MNANEIISSISWLISMIIGLVAAFKDPQNNKPWQWGVAVCMLLTAIAVKP